MAATSRNEMLLAIIWIYLGISCCSAMQCTQDVLGLTKQFHCPRPNDDRDEIYCCGPSGYQECCDDDDYQLLVNLGLSTGGIAAIIIGVIVIVGIITLVCCCCCSCCLLAKRRERRGVVLSPPPQTTTVINTQMPYPVYPSSGYSQVPQNYSQSGQMQQNPYPPYPVATGYPGQPLPQEYSKPPPYSQ